MVTSHRVRVPALGDTSVMIRFARITELDKFAPDTWPAARTHSLFDDTNRPRGSWVQQNRRPSRWATRRSDRTGNLGRTARVFSFPDSLAPGPASTLILEPR